MKITEVRMQKLRRKICLKLFISTALIILVFSDSLFAQGPKPRVIDVDVAKVAGKLDKSFDVCVGAGRANEGLRADWQRQLKIAHDECGFKYIRFHGLLTDDMGVYSEDKTGRPVYNWQYIDELFDFLQRIGMKPFVEVGFMPSALASGNKTVFWWRGNVTPPKDYLKWDDLIKALVAHWTERYGQDEVASWYFEIWNEPNLKDGFFTGDQQDYFKLYKETAISIKSISKRYRVGGPATAGNAWIPETITFCKQNNVPIDFISTHDYGVTQGFLDVTGNVGTVLSPNRNAISNNMKRSKQQILNSSIPGLELHYTEWSASYTPTDPIHDSYHEAAYILNTVKKAAPIVNSMSYWTFTDIFEEAGPRNTPFHGGFGLINYEDIKKPAYFAYQFLHQLGDEQLAVADSSSIVCKDKKGNVQALFWDFTIDHPGDSVNNQVFYKRNLPAKALPDVKVKFDGLKPGKYLLTVFQCGYEVNDAYTTYFKMGSPSQLTREQVNLIRDKNSGKALVTEIINIGGTGKLERSFKMRQNDVYLAKLTREN